MSYSPVQSLSPPIPNPPPNYHSLSFDSHHLPPPSFVPYSDSGIYPSNYSGFESQPNNYLDIQPLRQEAMASTTYDASSNYNLIGQSLVTNVPRKKPKRPKASIPKKLSVSQIVRCELCKIDCNNVHVYEKHLSGKKHAKGLQKLYAPALQAPATQATQSGCSTPGVLSKSANLEAKKQKLLEVGTAVQSLRVCAICNVVCNGETAFADHLVGKRHLAQERARSTASVNSGTLVNSNPASMSTLELNAKSKKRKKGEHSPAWCDVCKISCTSSDGLNIHLVGKKHKKNLQKLQNPNSNTITPASTSSPLPSTNPSIEVEGNIAAAETSASKPQQAKKKGNSKDHKDVETKKRNILACGATADAVKTCSICNVVCNSDTVFKSHLTGQKHATMVKQAANSGLQVAYSAS